MGAYARIEVTEPPIVQATILESPDDENYPEYLNGLAEAFRTLDRFGLVFDTGSLLEFPARYREMQAAWLAETKPEFEGRWICAAFVIESRMVRGALLTLFWLNPPYYKTQVFARVDDALAWTRDCLREAGVVLET